nr:hypothetical protein Iba_chr14aCG14500 [Ipomoea batatas]
MRVFVNQIAVSLDETASSPNVLFEHFNTSTSCCVVTLVLLFTETQSSATSLHLSVFSGLPELYIGSLPASDLKGCIVDDVLSSLKDLTDSFSAFPAPFGLPNISSCSVFPLSPTSSTNCCTCSREVSFCSSGFEFGTTEAEDCGLLNLSFTENKSMWPFSLLVISIESPMKDSSLYSENFGEQLVRSTLLVSSVVSIGSLLFQLLGEGFPDFSFGVFGDFTGRNTEERFWHRRR